MATVYERIDGLCKKAGVSHGKMCDELGYSRNTMSALKSGRSTTLKLEKAQRISDYFGVTVDYLLGNEQQKKPAPDNRSEQFDIAEEVSRIMEDLENSGDLMFDGDPASPEAVETIRNALTIGIGMARKINQKKQAK